MRFNVTTTLVVLAGLLFCGFSGLNAATYDCEATRFDIIDQLDHSTGILTPIAKTAVETADHAVSQIVVRDQPLTLSVFLCHGNLCSSDDDKLVCAFFDLPGLSKLENSRTLDSYLKSQCETNPKSSKARPVPGASTAHTSNFNFQALVDSRAAYSLSCNKRN